MKTYSNEFSSNFFTDNPPEIKEKAGKLIKKLTSLMAEADFQGINQLIQESDSMRYSIQGYLEELKLADREKDMLIYAGYNSALIDAMRLYAERLYAQEEIQKVRTRYKDAVLRILDKRGTLLHKDLAAELVVSASALTAIIKQMNATEIKLINIEEVSKFKLYSLTPIAHQYVMKCMPDKPTDTKPVTHTQYVIFGQKKVEMVKGRFDEQRESIPHLRRAKYNNNYDMQNMHKMSFRNGGTSLKKFDTELYAM